MSAQADRVEALLVENNALLMEVNGKLDTWLAAQSGEIRQPLDPGVWPDWYRDLYSLPNFQKTLEECSQWLVEKNLPEQKANETAAYIRGTWPGKKPRPWKQPWAVFRQLVPRHPPGAQGPSPAPEIDKYMAGYKRRWG